MAKPRNTFVSPYLSTRRQHVLCVGPRPHLRPHTTPCFNTEGFTPPNRTLCSNSHDTCRMRFLNDVKANHKDCIIAFHHVTPQSPATLIFRNAGSTMLKHIQIFASSREFQFTLHQKYSLNHKQLVQSIFSNPRLFYHQNSKRDLDRFLHIQ